MYDLYKGFKFFDKDQMNFVFNYTQREICDWKILLFMIYQV